MKSTTLSVVLDQHRIAVGGALVSVIVGGLSLLGVTAFEGFVLALIGTVLSLNLDALLRPGALQPAELRQSAPWAPTVMDDVLTSLFSIYDDAQSDLDPFRPSAERAVRQVAATLQQMASGNWAIGLRTQFEEFLIDGTNGATHTIRSVTIQSHDEERWDSEWGRRYWAANVTALARNVQIRRIFLIEQFTPYIQDLIEVQKAAGVAIKVMVNDGSDIPPRLYHNILIWDTTGAAESDVSARGDALGGRALAVPARVKEKVQEFEELWLWQEN